MTRREAAQREVHILETEVSQKVEAMKRAHHDVKFLVERVLVQEVEASDDVSKKCQLESLVKQRAEIWLLNGLLMKAVRSVKNYHRKSDRHLRKLIKFKTHVQEQFPECDLGRDADCESESESATEYEEESRASDHDDSRRSPDVRRRRSRSRAPMPER